MDNNLCFLFFVIFALFRGNSFLYDIKNGKIQACWFRIVPSPKFQYRSWDGVLQWPRLQNLTCAHGARWRK